MGGTEAICLVLIRTLEGVLPVGEVSLRTHRRLRTKFEGHRPKSVDCPLAVVRLHQRLVDLSKAIPSLLKHNQVERLNTHSSLLGMAAVIRHPQLAVGIIRTLAGHMHSQDSPRPSNHTDSSPNKGMVSSPIKVMVNSLNRGTAKFSMDSNSTGKHNSSTANKHRPTEAAHRKA